MLRATGIDHVVLRVTDARRSVDWYVRHLGLTPERLAEWESGEAPFVSVRIDADTIIDLLEVDDVGVPAATGSVDHLCLTVDATADELATWAAGEDVELERGPSRLFGARGVGTAVYVRDPDGHRVEVRTYDDAGTG